jgi:hypothetical protein
MAILLDEPDKWPGQDTRKIELWYAATEKFFVRSDVIEKFPFLVIKPSHTTIV